MIGLELSGLRKKFLSRTAVAGVLAGLTCLSSAAVCPSYIEAASLYDEYQSQNETRSSRANVKQSRASDVEKENRRLARESASPESKEPAGENALDFTARIRNILNSYHGNKYSRFLEQGTAGPNEGDISAPASSEAANGQEIEPVYDASASSEGLPAIPSGSSAGKPNLGEGRYNFRWLGTPLVQSLYALGTIAHKGIVINGDLKGSVHMSLTQETCNTALDYLSRAFGFNWMVDGNNIIISTDKQMLQSEVFEVDYADKDKLRDEFTSLGISKGNIYANSETGTISVTGTPYQLQQVRRRLKRLDNPVSQVLIAAQLIEISHGKELDLGFTYSLPTYSHSGTDGDTTGDTSLKGPWIPKLSFSASMQAQRSLSKGKVVSRPIVLARNGETASVAFGDQVPILSSTSTSSSTNVTVTYKDVGTTLGITPVINERTGDVSMNITAEVSNIVQYVSYNDTSAPQIATRKVNTSAHLKSGESLVIGGLMSVRDLDNLSGIPGLMNLPILGELFKFHSRSKSYAEVYIMITPFIMNSEVNARDVMRQVQE